MTLKDAIATHKIHNSDMTLVLKQQDELNEKVKKGASLEQFSIYGLGQKHKNDKNSIDLFKHSYEVYSMFNSFEAADPAGLSINKNILKKCPASWINLRADLNDTGVYIMRNIFKEKTLKIQMIDFDLVKLMVNNQFKRKLLKYIGKEYDDNDTKEIDDLLNKEISTEDRVVVMAFVKDNTTDIAVDWNIIENQVDSDEDALDSGEDETKPGASGDNMLIDSD